MLGHAIWSQAASSVMPALHNTRPVNATFACCQAPEYSISSFRIRLYQYTISSSTGRTEETSSRHLCVRSFPLPTKPPTQPPSPGPKTCSLIFKGAIVFVCARESMGAHILWQKSGEPAVELNSRAAGTVGVWGVKEDRASCSTWWAPKGIFNNLSKNTSWPSRWLA